MKTLSIFHQAQLRLSVLCSETFMESRFNKAVFLVTSQFNETYYIKQVFTQFSFESILKSISKQVLVLDSIRINLMQTNNPNRLK